MYSDYYKSYKEGDYLIYTHMYVTTGLVFYSKSKFVNISVIKYIDLLS